MKKFVLIDGNAILHRAYHALPPLTNKKGEIVNAVYGFFSMFLKIIGDLKPEYVAVCFDREAPTFRKELYVGYQAKRPKTADDLVPQIGVVHEVLEKSKVSIFEVDGYEADDLIGTLARQALEETVENRGSKVVVEDRRSKIEKKINLQSSTFKKLSSTFHHLSSNIEVVIVSGDRDMLQLVNSHVKVLAPIKGITEMILFDEKKVEEKYGIKPSQFIDYKALVGDSSDNYPGVAGIGPKTARDLLGKYENFENLYQNLSSLPERIGKKLATDAEQAALAKKLATIVTDASVSLELNECLCANFNIEGLKEEFEKLGFKSLIKRLQTKGAEEPNETKETEGRQEVKKKEKEQKATQMELI